MTIMIVHKHLHVFFLLNLVAVRALNGLQSSYNGPLSSQPSNTINKAQQVAAGYLFAEQTDARLNLSDAVDASLSRILDRDGPDMRPSRGFKESDDLTLEVSLRAWRLFYEHASIAVADRINLAQPAIEQLLIDANVSSGCKTSVSETFKGALRMESWAIKLLNSWGNFPPVGVFEGTYSDIGAFHACINIPNNVHIGHAHYCSLTYRPVLPKRKDYELAMTKEPDKLLHMFRTKSENDSDTVVRNAFDDLLDHAHYHH